MNKQKITRSKSSQQGVVIIEAMIAILLFSMGVLAIVGLQAAMIRNTDDSKYRAEAGTIAQKCIGEMWVNPGAVSCPNTIAFAASQNGLPNGNVQAVAGVAAAAAVPDQFQITVSWLQPGEPSGTPPHSFTTNASIAGNEN